MSTTSDAVAVEVPDIGDFQDVPIIEILVSAGDTVAVDDPLLTLESDKATMDVPAPLAGTVRELLVGVGDKVSQGAKLRNRISGERAPGVHVPFDVYQVVGIRVGRDGVRVEARELHRAEAFENPPGSLFARRIASRNSSPVRPATSRAPACPSDRPSASPRRSSG